MKKQNTEKGMMVAGSFRQSGVTFYLREGRMVGRSAHSNEKRSNTLGQFAQRQRMRHTVALWQMLKPCNPMFTENKSAYWGFISQANRLEVVYVPKNGPTSDASLLMPGIPVSGGTLPVVAQRLGEVEGTAALITDIKAGAKPRGERLLLYTAEQLTSRTPRVNFSVREVSRSAMAVVDGCLALKGEEFADEMKGWALVRTLDDRCSSQAIITRCTYYHQFTTNEALETAVKTYGGLTK